MKITMHMIRDYLRSYVLKEKLNSDCSIGMVETVSVFDPQLKTDPDKVYIVEQKNFRYFETAGFKGAFLFLSGGDPDIPINIKNDYLLLREKNAVFILQKLQNLFSTYHRWEVALYRAASQKKGIKNIAMTAAKLIQNPFFLYTSSLKLICCCNLTEKAEKFFHARGDFDLQIEGAYVTDEFLDKLKTDPERWRTIKMTGPEISPEGSLGYRTLSYNIFTGGIYVARLLICETEYKLKSRAFFILKTLGDFLTPFLEKEDMAVNAHTVNFDKYIQKLLEGEAVEETALKPVLKAFGWDKEDRYFCCYIPADPETVVTDIIMSTCFFLEVTCPGSAVITFNDHIVHIINLTAMKSEKARAQQTLRRLYRERNLRAGSSPELSDIYEISDRYKQAKAAYMLGARCREAENYFVYEEYGLQDILCIASGQYSLKVMCPEAIRRLMKYDRENDMKLTLTLKTYLRNDRSVAKSIRVLYMQRSTFLYQMRRVMEITELDLEDYDVRLYLQIYFAAEEIYGI